MKTARHALRQLPKVRKALALAFLILTFLLAYFLGTALTSVQEPNGGLLIAPTELDFGEVWQSTDFSWTIVVHNPTSKRIDIQNLESSCGCVNVDPSSLTLMPSEQNEVVLKLDLTRAQGPDMLKDFAVTLTPQLNGSSAGNLGWVLKGKVRTPFTVSPRNLLYDEPLIRGDPIPAKHTRVKGLLPLAGLVTECKLDEVLLQCSTAPDEPNAFDIIINPAPNIPAGPFSFNVSVRAKTAKGVLPPVAQITVSGKMDEDVQAFPSSLDLGFQTLGGAGQETITFQSRSKKCFNIIPPNATADGLTVIALEGADKSRRAFKVKQTINSAGSKSSAVIFFATISTGERVQVPVFVSYYGLQGTARVPLRSNRNDRE